MDNLWGGAAPSLAGARKYERTLGDFMDSLSVMFTCEMEKSGFFAPFCVALWTACRIRRFLPSVRLYF